MKNNKKEKPQILIVAGEASSELYAFRVMEEIHRRGIDAHFFGIGSKRMAEAGFEVIEKAENIAVVGVSEVFSQLRVILRALGRLAKTAEERKPALALLLDLPDFNLRLAKKLKHLDVPIIYYISPQIWAWRKGRVHTIKKLVKKMLIVFPFEKSFYEEHGVPVEFVGHPILDELQALKMTDSQRQSERAKYGVTLEHHLVGLLPGSRKGELRHMLETQVRAAEKIAARNANVRFFILVAPSLDVEFVRSQLPVTSINVVLIKDEPVKVMRLADSLIVASGTATLFAGLAAVPMVIMYKVSPLSYVIGRAFIHGVKWFGLPNLILGEEVVPELLQSEASPERLAAEIQRYISEPEHSRRTREKLLSIRTRLGTEGATKRVADELVEFLGSH